MSMKYVCSKCGKECSADPKGNPVKPGISCNGAISLCCGAKIIEEVAPIYEKTLRDEFAMAALAGYNTKGNRLGMSSNGCSPEEIDKNIAKACYLFADAMMEARG